MPRAAQPGLLGIGIDSLGPTHPLTGGSHQPGPPPHDAGVRVGTLTARHVDSPMRRPLACFRTVRIHPVGREVGQ